MVPILKSYYKEMFFEFLNHEESRDTIILLAGFPSNNNYDEIIRFLFDKGYNVLFPRFKGMYQSKGEFLEGNYLEELREFISEVPNSKIQSLWDDKLHEIKTNKTILFSSSFSGAIACNLGKSNDIDKLILFSPVLDYSNHNNNGNEQELGSLTNFVKKAYNNCYRFNFLNIQDKLAENSELSLENLKKDINNKIMILHDKEDKEVSYDKSKQFCDETKNLLLTHSMGHGMNINTIKENFQRLSL